MHRIFAGVLTLIAASAAHAQERPAQIAPYATRCVEEAGTGFNWSKGKWVLTTFNRQTLMVTKFDEALHKDDLNL